MQHLDEPLAAYDGQLLVYVTCYIPAGAASILGLLADTIGDRDSATRDYTDALNLEDKIAART